MQPTFNEVMQGFNTAIKQMVQETIKIEVGNQFANYLQEYELDKIRNAIAAMPERIEAKKELIAEKREQIRTARQSLVDADQAVKEAEATLIAEIAGEVNAVGKPAFSNDKARQAEFMRRKKDDETYKIAFANYWEAKTNVEQLEDIIASHDIELKRMETEFTATITQIQSIIAEIQFYTAAVDAIEVNKIIDKGESCKCQG